VKVEIFDVEHGGCALVAADTGAHMLIDCGHNTSTGWRPSKHLFGEGIHTVEMFVVTNCDEDHVSDLPNLRQTLRGRQVIHLMSLLRNKTISSQALKEMKKDGGMGDGIREFVSMINEYTGGPYAVDWGAMSYKVFYNEYPDHFDNSTNNLSLVIFLHCYGLHIIFPGDLEEVGWKRLLKSSAFVEELETVNVFVASHHGRESGCCEEVFQIAKPEIAIFSDAGIQYDTQNTVSWYKERCGGIEYNGEQRYVFTTRNDGKITLDARPERTFIRTA